MYRTAKQIEPRKAERLRGGEGTIVFRDFLKKEEACGAGRLFAHGVLPVGASVGEHAHEGEFEVYYVLSGEAEVLDDGTPVRLGAGDMHMCQSGHRHALRNAGKTDLEMIMLILFDQTARP